MSLDAESLYAEILASANHFLHNCKNFPISILANENPSYEEVAQLADMTRKILHALMDDLDPQLTQQAYDYCGLMKRMAVAITNHDEHDLNEAVAILGKKPFTLQ